MKGTVFATLVAAAIGLAAPTSAAIAAPVNGVVIGHAANLDNPVTQVQHYRWRSRGWRHSRGRSVAAHYRWRSRGWRHSRGRSVAAHYRWRSRGWRHSRGRSVAVHYRWRSLGWKHSRGRSSRF